MYRRRESATWGFTGRCWSKEPQIAAQASFCSSRPALYRSFVRFRLEFSTRCSLGGCVRVALGAPPWGARHACAVARGGSGVQCVSGHSAWHSQPRNSSSRLASLPILFVPATEHSLHLQRCLPAEVLPCLIMALLQMGHFGTVIGNPLD